MSTRDLHKQIAAELAETAMTLARDIAAQALAATETAEKIALAAAYEKLARSVRLSIGLCEKLEGAERQPAEAGLSAEARDSVHRLETRKRQLRDGGRRAFPREADREDVEVLEEALDLIVEEMALSPTFAVDSMKEMVARVRRWLDLPETISILLPPEREASLIPRGPGGAAQAGPQAPAPS